MDNIYNIRGHIDDKSSVINVPNNDSQSTSSVSFQFKESISMWTMTEMFRSTPDRKEQPAEPPRVPYPHRLWPGEVLLHQDEIRQRVSLDTTPLPPPSQ